MDLPPYPQDPTPLQKAFHDYIRHGITYDKFKEVLEASLATGKEANAQPTDRDR